MKTAAYTLPDPELHRAFSCSNNTQSSSNTVCCAADSCTLFKESEKLKLRAGKLVMRGKYMPTRRAVDVEIYLVPPMLIYGRATRPKVLHLDRRFSVCSNQTNNNSFTIKSSRCSREFTFECKERRESGGHCGEWIDDISSALSMCVSPNQQLPECADFARCEQAIDDFQEARESRDLLKAERAVAVMRMTLNRLLIQHENLECVQRLGDKYEAWLECATVRLAQLHARHQRRCAHQVGSRNLLRCASDIGLSTQNHKKTLVSTVSSSREIRRSLP